MTAHFTAKLAIDSSDKLGESPAWDAGQDRLIWIDQVSEAIYEARADSIGGWSKTRDWQIEGGVSAAMPSANGGILALGGPNVYLIDKEGAMSIFASIPDSHRSMHDGKVDHLGRLWAGAAHYPDGDLNQGDGALYRIDPDGKVTLMLDGILCPNGLDWSPDGSTFYFIDNFAFTLDAFDCDMAKGTISNRRNFVTYERGNGFPDGMCVDREGCLWVAIAGGGAVLCYAPDSTVIARVEVPVLCPTSCAFGGSNGETLFITSAAMVQPEVLWPLIGYNAEKVRISSQSPGVGGVFVCRTGSRAMPATPFACQL